MLNCYDNRTEYQILDDLKAKPASPFKTSRYSQNGITLTLIQHWVIFYLWFESIRIQASIIVLLK